MQITISDLQNMTAKQIAIFAAYPINNEEEDNQQNDDE